MHKKTWDLQPFATTTSFQISPLNTKFKYLKIAYFISIINDDEGKPSELKSVAVGVSDHA